MAQKTGGPQKQEYSYRSGSPSLPSFLGEETDGDDPASARSGSFRTLINARRLQGMVGGSLGPRGGLTKVNTDPLGSPVIGLFITGDGFGVPAENGFCGTSDSGLIWGHHNLDGDNQYHYVIFYFDTGELCAVLPSDQTPGVVHIVGRPRYGLEGGLGNTFYLPGSSDFDGVNTMMRVVRAARGPYPLLSGGTYGMPISPLFSTPDPTEGAPGSGFFSMASLPGAPNIGDGTGKGEQFFLGWSKHDGSAATADDFHVYRLEISAEDNAATLFEGESLFSTTDAGHMQVWDTPMGEIVAILSAPDHDGNFPQTNRLRYRNAAGTWADLPTIDISGLPVFDGGPLASIRNIIVHDAKVYLGKLWIAITGSAFNGGGAKFGGFKGLLLSWNGTTLKAERVFASETANSKSHALGLWVEHGKLWYAWDTSTPSPDTRAAIGSYDGTTFTDQAVEFFDNFGLLGDCKIRHFIWAASRWWALVKQLTGEHVHMMSTTDPTMATGWASFVELTNTLHWPDYDTGTSLGALVGDEAISDIQVL